MITLTASASEYIKKKLAKEEASGFRLSITKTGCSGYAYQPSMVHDRVVASDIVETCDGITVYIDQAWLTYLQGVVVDYKEEDKSGLRQKRLVFTNPNESDRCGCGESFHIKQQDEVDRA